MTARKRLQSAGSQESSSSMSQVANSLSCDQPPPTKRKIQRIISGRISQSNRKRACDASRAQHPVKESRMDKTPTVSLDDSLRALYFAPIAIIVLDQTRSIFMLNGPAEVMLGIASRACYGQQWENYLPPSSKETLRLALDQASQSFISSTAKLSTPIVIRLETNLVQGQSSNWVDLSISAWSQSQVAFDNLQDVDSARSAQNTFFTISMQSCSVGSEIQSEKPIESKKESDLVKIFAVQDLDLPFMAISPNGKIIDHNKASERLWSNLKDEDPNVESVADLSKNDMIKEEFDASWIHELARLTDETFENELPETDWPMYKCAIMGEKVSPTLMGIESKITGKRIVVEFIGYPIRANDGKREHLGGVLTFRNVTADKERLQREAVHQGDIYFKKTCNAMPQLVFVTDPVGKSEWYSDSWYEYSGAPQDVADTKAWSDYFHPDDLDDALQCWLKAVEDKQLWDTTFRIRRHDGAWRWFQGRALPIKEATGDIRKWYGTLTDINDHQESLSASRRAQSQLESVIYHADVTIWAVNREGIITIAKGPGVRQLKLAVSNSSGSERENSNDGIGMTQQRLNLHGNNEITIGESIYDIWDSKTIQRAINQALDGETIVEEMEIDGRWFRTSFTPMRSQVDEIFSRVGEYSSEDTILGEGEIIGVVGVSMDVTERKAAQAQMEKSLLDKTSALAAEGAAREASRLKSEFLANMSHEIRTPIAGVIGLSELILDETDLTQKLRDYVETIQRSADGLLHVINDVLDFSKVEVGKLDVEQTPFSLNTLLLDAKRMLTFATEKKGLDFKEPQELIYKGSLIGDFGRLKQVIINLLSNAIKFTSQGYISLEVTEFEEDDDKLQVCFDIRDTGSGISEKSLAGLFQPFSQADPSTARRFGGTGLGLSISKNLVELMGGKIGLNSIEGQGSHAWFSIPFLKAKGVGEVNRIHLEDESTSVDAVVDELPSTIERPRGDIWILIAEDNEVNARIAYKNIERMGFHCRIANDGLSALQELNSKKFDLVLMDCQMPGCDGYEATKLLRKSTNPYIRALPVIALTASAITGDRERALEAGMVDYLSKPVKRSALETALCKWLFDHQARQILSKYKDTPLSPVTQGEVFKRAVKVNWNEQVQVERSTETSLLPFQEDESTQDYHDFRNGSDIGSTASLLTARRCSADIDNGQPSTSGRSSLPLGSQLCGALSSISANSALTTSSPNATYHKSFH